jgi:hypothetical protein
MYHTFRELVIATKEKFADQKFTNGGTYSPSLNQIGCGIGCHFTLEQQAALDSKEGMCSIGNILLTDHAKTAIVRSIMGPAITYHDLRQLQDWHDQYWYAEDFISCLDMWLAANPEEPEPCLLQTPHDLFFAAAGLQALPF